MRVGSAAETLNQGRVALAFLLAPVITAAMLGLGVSLGGLLTGEAAWPQLGLMVAIFGYLYFGLLPALMLGVPAFFLLRPWIAMRASSAAATGATISAVTGAGLGMLFFGQHGGTADPPAIKAIAAAAGLAAMPGALGGWVFWLIAAWRTAPTPPPPLRGPPPP